MGDLFVLILHPERFGPAFAVDERAPGMALLVGLAVGTIALRRRRIS